MFQKTFNFQLKAMQKTGIYLIQSIQKPDKFYIGSAVNILSRWLRHLSELRKGKHCNRHMQHHFNKYGEEDFIFSILQTCQVSELLFFEQLHIDTKKPTFNICQNAESRLNVKSSIATKAKIKASCKLRPAVSIFSRLSKQKNTSNLPE
jgi:group I intron endonuclease